MLCMTYSIGIIMQSTTSLLEGDLKCGQFKIGLSNLFIRNYTGLPRRAKPLKLRSCLDFAWQVVVRIRRIHEFVQILPNPRNINAYVHKHIGWTKTPTSWGYANNLNLSINLCHQWATRITITNTFNYWLFPTSCTKLIISNSTVSTFWLYHLQFHQILWIPLTYPLLPYSKSCKFKQSWAHVRDVQLNLYIFNLISSYYQKSSYNTILSSSRKYD